MDKKKIIIVVVALVAIAGLIWFFSTRYGSSGVQQVSKLDVIDTVGNFYGEWLKAVQEPTTADPSRKVLAKSPILSKALSERLVMSQKAPTAGPDPVLCQPKTPESISTIRVYEQADKAQVLVVSRDKRVTEQALVTLLKLNEGWYIDNIECSAGEIPPVREFSFEKEGFLLKASIPKPFDPKNWHLVYVENGVPGHVVPLFFDATSQCTDLGGTKAVCKPAELKEMTKVFVQAQMTERGANLKNLKFVK